MPDRIVVNFTKNEVRYEPEPARGILSVLMRALRRRRRTFVLTGGSAPAPQATKATQRQR